MAITINGTGSITGLTAGGLPDGSVTAADIETSLDLTGKTVTLPSGTGGKVLQVVQDSKTDAWSTIANLNTKATITGLSASITISDANNKVLVLMDLGIVGASGDTTFGGTIQRGSTAIGIADTASTRTRNTFGGGLPCTGNTWRGHPVSHCWLDSPGTGTHTYTVKIGGNGGVYISVNYDDRNSDSSTDAVRTSSTITLMEVAP
jgi:hypothetical protein